jgi:hypothetical protein
MTEIRGTNWNLCYSVCRNEGLVKLHYVIAVCLQTWTEVAILLNRVTMHHVVCFDAVAVLSRAITRYI